MKKNTGFTLIELMVSVAIIAMLTAIAMVTFSGANKKARDGRRKADLEKIRISLELYRQEVGSYPTDVADLVPNYLQELPIGPKDDPYLYERNVGSSFVYTLDAKLEDIGATNGTYDVGCSGVCNYRVNSP